MPWELCLVVGVLGTGVAYVATATLTGRVGSTRSSVLTYLATLISITLGIAVRGEAVVWLTAVGTAFTLMGPSSPPGPPVGPGVAR